MLAIIVAGEAITELRTKEKSSQSKNYVKIFNDDKYMRDINDQNISDKHISR